MEIRNCVGYKELCGDLGTRTVWGSRNCMQAQELEEVVCKHGMQESELCVHTCV